MPLLRPNTPIGWRLRLLREALAFLAVFVYATHATQAIAFEWKPGLRKCVTHGGVLEDVVVEDTVAPERDMHDNEQL